MIQIMINYNKIKEDDIKQTHNIQRLLIKKTLEELIRSKNTLFYEYNIKEKMILLIVFLIKKNVIYYFF